MRYLEECNKELWTYREKCKRKPEESLGKRILRPVQALRYLIREGDFKRSMEFDFVTKMKLPRVNVHKRLWMYRIMYQGILLVRK